MSEELDRVDKTIDAALESYTPRAARPGLEQRILASVVNASITRNHETRWWSRRLGWAVGAVLLTAALLPVALQQSRPRPMAVHAPSVSDAMERTATAASVVANAARLVPVAHRLRRYSADESAVGISGRDATSAASLPFEPLREDVIEIKPITIAPIQIAALN